MDKTTLKKLRDKLPIGYAATIAEKLGISRKAVDNNLGGKTKKINQRILEEAIALANKTVDLSKQVKEISDYK